MFNFLFKKEENNIIKYKPKECVKKSKLKLNNHQKRVIERIFLKDGILLVHSTGTGKTLTAVGVSECLLDNGIVDNVVVSAPRVLVENFHKELKAYGVIQNYDKYHVNTYIKTLRFLEKQNKNFLDKTLIIIDEAHNLRTPITKKKGQKELSTGKTAYEYIRITRKCSKVILLTATPLINKPQEFNNLMQMVNKTGNYMSMKKFNKKFITPNLNKSNKENKKELKKIKIFNANKAKNLSAVEKGVKKFIEEIKDKDIVKNRKLFFGHKLDFYNREINSEFYPNSIIHNIHLYMSEEYYKLYRKVEKKVISRLGELKNFDLQGKNSSSYYISLRQYSNAIPSDGYKIDWIISKVEENKKLNLKTLICSQFIAAGIKLLEEKLDWRGIKYNTITGKTSSKKIPEIVKSFNLNKFDILFISKAASEGLDLKGVREVILMEPFWNLNDRQQVIGRAIRFKSHYNLPREQQIVNIYNLFVLKPKSNWTLLKVNMKYFSVGDSIPSVDAYLFLLAVLKQGIINVFLKDVMKYNKYTLIEEEE
jgi:superfamily II DNA or RNA helicase